MPLANKEHMFKGMMKDMAKESFNTEYYYDAHCIKVVNNDIQSTLAISNEKGTTLEFSFPTINKLVNVDGNTTVEFVTPSGVITNSPLVYEGTNVEVESLDIITHTDYKVIGSAETDEFIVYITTNDNGLDCVWKVYKDTSWYLDLIYINDLNLSTDYPPELKLRYDSEELIKLYFTDYNNQLRHISLTDDTIHNQKASFLDIVPDIALSQPVVTEKSFGGLNTSGMVQYAYNLYNINGAQSKISPISELKYLASPSRGGDVNEVVGQTNTISIDNIDQNYDAIKVYRVKYNSFAQDPIISVLADQRVTNTLEYFYDDGKVLYDISLSEFLFFGGDPIYCRSMETKDNRLILANYKTGNFDIDFDARAYSYSEAGVCNLADSLGTETTYSDPITQVALEADSINPDFNTYKYRDITPVAPVGGKYVKTSGLGGTGGYIDYFIYQYDSTELSGVNAETENRFLKSREIYRIAIEFYNTLGQTTLPKWIADFKVPHGNITENYNILEVTLSSAAITYLESQGVVGWRTLRARRDVTDMTVLSQGMINPTVFQVTEGDSIGTNNQSNDGEEFEDQHIKLPTTFTRTFDAYSEAIPASGSDVYNDLVIHPIQNGKGAFSYRQGGIYDNPSTEIYTDYYNKSHSYRKQLTYIYSKMFTFYSPEIQFRENFNLESSVFLNPIGTYKTQVNGAWGREYGINDRRVRRDFTTNSGLSLHGLSSGTLQDYGLIGPAKDSDYEQMDIYQYYRKFSEFTLGYNWDEQVELASFPEIAERSAELTYNGDDRLRFFNSLYGLISDDAYNGSGSDIDGLVGVNSEGTKTLVMAEKDLTKLEEIYYDDASTLTSTGLPIAELSRVLPNQYGGSSFEARKRTVYLRIGSFNEVENSTEVIESPGDVFIHNYRFSRILPITKDLFNPRFTQYNELVEFPVETVIDLKNRKDESNNEWNSNFQPIDDEAHNYNSVYSQEADWNVTQDLEYNFNEIEIFPNALIPSKVKIDNELVDSWTEFLYNEELKIEGKHGEISKIIAHNDTVVTFQPKGICMIAVNPRVQVLANDGSSMEMGTGGILHDFKYLTTTSGSANRYSVLSTSNGLYYYDALNNSFNSIAGGKVVPLSKELGMDTYFNNNIIYSEAIVDNPFKGSGVILLKDDVNDGILFINKGTNTFNTFLSDKLGTFSTFLPYYPNLVNHHKHQMISIDGVNLTSHYTGNYNEYYGVKYPSKITLLVNIKNYDNIFNGIEYRSEVYDNGVDVPNITFTGIQAYNEYQDTGDRVLTLGSNLFKKFRTWRIQIPRDQVQKLDRIRGPWAFIELEFNVEDNYKFICHNPKIHFEDATIKA